MNRKQWVVSAAGAAVLALGAGAAYEFQPDTDRTILSAIGPVILGDALPPGTDALDAFVAGFDTAVAGLTPSVQHELAQLMTMLRTPPTRMLLAGLMKPWHLASPASVNAFLTRWRFSGIATLRSGYDALHQLSMAAWYGNDRAWRGIGYPGPPNVHL